ncbi:MAG: mycofactocin biosynthesis chaperone MftB [Acidimicrobiales bacterium]
MSSSTTDVFDASASWRLSEQVSLRDEAFGALAYHHGNRRLVFLKSRELVAIVRGLSQFSSAHEAIDAFVEPSRHERYVAALSSLFASELLSGR